MGKLVKEFLDKCLHNRLDQLQAFTHLLRLCRVLHDGLGNMPAALTSYWPRVAKSSTHALTHPGDGEPNYLAQESMPVAPPVF